MDQSHVRGPEAGLSQKLTKQDRILRDSTVDGTFALHMGNVGSILSFLILS